ncbi:phosphatidylinositol kinase- protein kinase tor1, partial [Coemansia sp. 'formosensis']
MGKTQNIQKLLLLLNDEVFSMRCNALAVAGRLAKKNPAYLQPIVPRMVAQVLTEFDFYHGPSEREESIQLLMALVQAAEHLVRPFAGDILHIVAPHINDSPPQLASRLFDIVAVLARASGSDLEPYHDRLLDNIILALSDQS